MSKPIDWSKPLIDEDGYASNFIGKSRDGHYVVEHAPHEYFTYQENGFSVNSNAVFVRNAPERKKVWVTAAVDTREGMDSIYSKAAKTKSDLLDHMKLTSDMEWSTPIEVEIEIP